MPIPASINDLSTTAASNSPGGTEDLGTADDYLRTYASYIAALRDVVLAGTANLTTANITYTGTLTGSTGVLNIGSGQVYKDASGNVGLGVTLPAWSGLTAVQIKAASLSGNASGAEGLYLASNAYYNAAWKYAASTYATKYEQGSGSHTWSIAASGTAGNNITFTDVMRIDSSGNQINTPSNTPPTLTVNGQMNLTPTSNTNIRISYRGSDGTTRVADITLA